MVWLMVYHQHVMEPVQHNSSKKKMHGACMHYKTQKQLNTNVFVQWKNCMYSRVYAVEAH